MFPISILKEAENSCLGTSDLITCQRANISRMSDFLASFTHVHRVRPRSLLIFFCCVIPWSHKKPTHQLSQNLQQTSDTPFPRITQTKKKQTENINLNRGKNRKIPTTSQFFYFFKVFRSSPDPLGQALPSGLRYVAEFISPREEEELLQAVNARPWLENLIRGGVPTLWHATGGASKTLAWKRGI